MTFADQVAEAVHMAYMKACRASNYRPSPFYAGTGGAHWPEIGLGYCNLGLWYLQYIEIGRVTVPGLR